MTVRYLLICALTYCCLVRPIGLCEIFTDSVAAAITVYRNPAFFKNLTEETESKTSEKEREEANVALGDENNGNVHEGIAEKDFYDLADYYLYPGEPKKPKPPSEPDFSEYYGPEYNSYGDDSSNNFVAEDSSPIRYDEVEEEEDRRESWNELGETSEREIESTEQSSSSRSKIRESKFRIPFDGDLIPKTEPKLYDDSKRYFNPVFVRGMNSFAYPATYEDLDYYSYSKSFEEKRRKKIEPETYVDGKKGTREYYRNHGIEKVEERTVPLPPPPPPPRPQRYGDVRHVFKTMSKVDVTAARPILLVPYVAPKYRTKLRISYQPKIVKLRIVKRI